MYYPPSFYISGQANFTSASPKIIIIMRWKINVIKATLQPATVHNYSPTISEMQMCVVYCMAILGKHLHFICSI